MAGELHTVALRTDGAVLSWGDNQRGQLGRHSEEAVLRTPGHVALPLEPRERALRVAAGGYRSAVLTNHGRLLTMGFHDEKEQQALEDELLAEEMAAEQEEEEEGDSGGGVYDDPLADGAEELEAMRFQAEEELEMAEF